MSIADLFHNVLGHHDTSEEVVGTIVDKPVLRDNDKATGEIVSFHLDSRPEVEFRQELSPLTPTHHPGDPGLLLLVDSGG